MIVFLGNLKFVLDDICEAEMVCEKDLDVLRETFTKYLQGEKSSNALDLYKRYRQFFVCYRELDDCFRYEVRKLSSKG